MKTTHLLALSAALSAVLILAASAADAQERRFVNGGWGNPPVPRHGGHHGGRFRGGVFIPYYVDREIHVVEREVIREVPVIVEPAPPPPPPRKPYRIGASYASLPAGCMKLIEDGQSYYYCSGEWYRQVGGAGYKAVARP